MREIIEGGPRAAIAGRGPLPAIFPSAVVPPAKKRLANHARPKALPFSAHAGKNAYPAGPRQIQPAIVCRAARSL
jgi:hypothetical protein